MGDTRMGFVIGGAALAVALTMMVVLYWLERRRARLLREFDHRDCWRAAYGGRPACGPARRARRTGGRAA
ncbi:hypothetical protein [Burkholderia stagnalis]|uniref:Uncharacterized protein n=1 Tax=Burkholderia stagnalis TaxID=1503054 RepID=A0A119W982_9BURK|nr:hypothetical protein [Burkholderia stagnalis]KVZ06468.1 hypothetical protein WT35_21255 [Burkholderia stagnalis]KWA48167.1 hypothetical protein WT42_24745 [Burkholderia stagnalis]KWA53128.1 hypothetical protein WT43_03825 [Burkholderia stagnalis]KWA66822.1 hypothetical protein WT44_03815 [Burkholderia stagnalis]KWC95147.1 hypothetical protein WT45_23875 [Burkholderia stagnalis]